LIGGVLSIWYTTRGSRLRRRSERPLSDQEEARVEAIIARSLEKH